MAAPAVYWRHYSGYTGAFDADEPGAIWVETTNPNGSYAVSAGGYAAFDPASNSTSTDTGTNDVDPRIHMIGTAPSYDPGTDTMRFLVGFATPWPHVPVRLHLYAIVP